MDPWGPCKGSLPGAGYSAALRSKPCSGRGAGRWVMVMAELVTDGLSKRLEGGLFRKLVFYFLVAYCEWNIKMEYL